jgi:hypothetical protein
MTAPVPNLSPVQGEAFAVSAALYWECRVVSDFTSSYVRARIPDPQSLSQPDQLLFRQLLRADAWLRTLGKLDGPSDFQAVSSGCRSLMEVAVDIVLLSSNKADFQKVIDWEDSAKLKHARSLETYYQKTGGDLAKDHSEIAKFIQRSAARIEAARQAHGWMKNGKIGHPDRWTAQPLSVDCIRADRAQSVFSFEAFYESRYRELCWNVHGSGLVVNSVTTEHFPFIGGRAFRECAELGQVTSETVLRSLGLWDAEVQAAFEELKKHRILTAGLTLRDMRARFAAAAVQPGVAADRATPGR